MPLTFFRKSSGSISGPYDDVVKPRPRAAARLRGRDRTGVRPRRCRSAPTITEDNLADYVAGLVVTNDVSARDVQLPKTQFYEGKSYPTFTPVGPALVLLDADELKRFTDLRLRLSVNGEVRQDSTVADMIYQPVQALQALTRFQRLDPGDLLLTGTPVGTALSAPPKPVEIDRARCCRPRSSGGCSSKPRPRTRSTCRTATSSRPSIATDDGAIDLGTQRTAVRWTP